jgi:hypothetical protein
MLGGVESPPRSLRGAISFSRLRGNLTARGKPLTADEKAHIEESDNASAFVGFLLAHTAIRVRHYRRGWSVSGRPRPR